MFVIWVSVYGGIRGSCDAGTGNPSTSSTAAVLGLASAYFTNLFVNWQAFDKFLWRRNALIWLGIVVIELGMCGLDFNDPTLAAFGMFFGWLASIVVMPSEVERGYTTAIRAFAGVVGVIPIFVMNDC
eukprot:TRINITY_DN6571_c0_g1_i5.p2 TRINITY_DN6571_c0_g1~~TRINITY_DN6571_c0_g1_i5.p2  ORF type:complete len:128 (+),score=16.75 TRINITY_DN6571_c0_g1_i5:369-752(+)